MRIRNRNHREEAPVPEPQLVTGEAGIEDAARRARGLLDAADDAIERALSGDSRRFLAQNRQQGGQ